MKKYLLILLLIFFSRLIIAQSVAWNRASKIGKGMNLSWLDHRWKGSNSMAHSDYVDMDDLSKYKSQIKLMHDIGYTYLRLPVCFDLWYLEKAPFTLLTPQYFTAIDSIIQWTKENNMMLTIDNHHGKIRSENLDADVKRICAIWKDVATHYKYTNPEQVFFEIFNEPSEVTEEEWQESVKKIIKSIRAVDKSHTLIVGGAKWNSINTLIQMPLLQEKNLIYTFHFYEPFLFTHQGASWIGDPATTINIPYPYRPDDMPPISDKAANSWATYIYPKYPNEADYQSLYSSIKKAKDWSLKIINPLFVENGEHTINTLPKMTAVNI